jgi:hypothetical protein
MHGIDVVRFMLAWVLQSVRDVPRRSCRGPPQRASERSSPSAKRDGLDVGQAGQASHLNPGGDCGAPYPHQQIIGGTET